MLIVDPQLLLHINHEFLKESDQLIEKIVHLKFGVDLIGVRSNQSFFDQKVVDGYIRDADATDGLAPILAPSNLRRGGILHE